MNYLIINIIIFTLYCLSSYYFRRYRLSNYEEQSAYQLGLAFMAFEVEATKARDMQELRDKV